MSPLGIHDVTVIIFVATIRKPFDDSCARSKRLKEEIQEDQRDDGRELVEDEKGNSEGGDGDTCTRSELTKLGQVGPESAFGEWERSKRRQIWIGDVGRREPF
jgi:hypothetical protein